MRDLGGVDTQDTLHYRVLRGGGELQLLRQMVQAGLEKLIRQGPWVEVKAFFSELIPALVEQQLSTEAESHLTGGMVRGNRLSDVVDRIGDLDVQVARLEDGVVNLNQQVAVLSVPVFVRLQPDVVGGPVVRLGDLGEIHRHEGGLFQILHE